MHVRLRNARGGDPHAGECSRSACVIYEFRVAPPRFTGGAALLTRMWAGNGQGAAGREARLTALGVQWALTADEAWEGWDP